MPYILSNYYLSISIINKNNTEYNFFEYDNFYYTTINPIPFNYLKKLCGEFSKHKYFHSGDIKITNRKKIYFILKNCPCYLTYLNIIPNKYKLKYAIKHNEKCRIDISEINNKTYKILKHNKVKVFYTVYNPNVTLKKLMLFLQLNPFIFVDKNGRYDKILGYLLYIKNIECIKHLYNSNLLKKKHITYHVIKRQIANHENNIVRFLLNKYELDTNTEWLFSTITYDNLEIFKLLFDGNFDEDYIKTLYKHSIIKLKYDHFYFIAKNSKINILDIKDDLIGTLNHTKFTENNMHIYLKFCKFLFRNLNLLTK